MMAHRTAQVHMQIAIARLVQSVGWAGIAGMLLVIAAVGTMISMRPISDGPLPVQAVPASAQVAVNPPATEDAATTVLPPVDDIPLLLTRIQRAAVAQGLGWPRADYRLNAATEEAPASLDLRFVLKGPYPNVRGFVTEVLQDIPTLTLKEFNLARPTSESADVEAKLSMVVYLRAPKVAGQDHVLKREGTSK